MAEFIKYQAESALISLKKVVKELVHAVSEYDISEGICSFMKSEKSVKPVFVFRVVAGNEGS